jgi:hypothetical protein
MPPMLPCALAAHLGVANDCREDALAGYVCQHGTCSHRRIGLSQELALAFYAKMYHTTATLLPHGRDVVVVSPATSRTGRHALIDMPYVKRTTRIRRPLSHRPAEIKRAGSEISGGTICGALGKAVVCKTAHRCSHCRS